MRYPIFKSLTLTRNKETAIRELHERHNTVASDSVFGSAPGTAKMNLSVAALSDVLRVELRWVFRDHWRLECPDYKPGTTLSFNVYAATSHKYWLRSLIRRCR